MQFCYADLEQLIIISPSRQDHDRTYQEKVVNVNYVIDLLSSPYDTNTQFLLDDILYFKFKISHICCHNFYMCAYCLSCYFYKLDVDSVFKRIWKKMLVLCFFLCIFAILNTSCVNSSAIMGFRGIQKNNNKKLPVIFYFI
jgi:hypothetical protein